MDIPEQAYEDINGPWKDLIAPAVEVPRNLDALREFGGSLPKEQVALEELIGVAARRRIAPGVSTILMASPFV